MDTAAGGNAYVLTPIEQALDDIYDDYEDAGSKFWSGVHTIKEALKSDLKAFCG
jgi:hypothetical protein